MLSLTFHNATRKAYWAGNNSMIYLLHSKSRQNHKVTNIKYQGRRDVHQLRSKNYHY